MPSLLARIRGLEKKTEKMMSLERVLNVFLRVSGEIRLISFNDFSRENPWN